MIKLRYLAFLLPIVISSPAIGTTISDPVGDFLPSFTGTPNPDLDVTSFSVNLNSAGTTFSLGAVLAGDINPALAGLYVIGVDTGSGVIAPFGSIGEPNVIFNQAIVVQKNGTATLGGNPLTILMSGNQFIVDVPVSLLPSTGALPANYSFNIWPRDTSVSGLGQFADFAPNNAMLSAVPEPATWATMLLGFCLAGGAIRFRRRRQAKGPIPQLA